MNEVQQTFTVFFAIFWGAIFNVLPKWKPFPFPVLVDVSQAKYRLVLSIVLLNIAPISFFGWTIYILSFIQITDWNATTIATLLASAVIPAFSNFGFYRVWVWFVEWKPSWFYRTNGIFQPNIPVEAEPTVVSLGLDYATIKTCSLHLVTAILYLAAAFISPWIVR